MNVDKPHAVIVKLALSRGWAPKTGEDGDEEGAQIAREIDYPESQYWQHLKYDSVVTDDQFRVHLYAAAMSAIEFFYKRGDL
jgi:hypothetical protein